MERVMKLTAIRAMAFAAAVSVLSACSVFHPDLFTTVPNAELSFSPKLIGNMKLGSYRPNEKKVWVTMAYDRESFHEAMKTSIANSLELAGLLSSGQDAGVTLNVYLEKHQLRGLILPSVSVTMKYEIVGNGFDETFTISTESKTVIGTTVIVTSVDAVEENFEQMLEKLGTL
jgi:hypothetical protein